MVAPVAKSAREGRITREIVRKEAAEPKPGRPKARTFSYKAPTKRRSDRGARRHHQGAARRQV